LQDGMFRLWHLFCSLYWPLMRAIAWLKPLRRISASLE
jgi:hypothetical protein